MDLSGGLFGTDCPAIFAVAKDHEEAELIVSIEHKVARGIRGDALVWDSAVGVRIVVLDQHHNIVQRLLASNHRTAKFGVEVLVVGQRKTTHHKAEYADHRVESLPSVHCTYLTGLRFAKVSAKSRTSRRVTVHS